MYTQKLIEGYRNFIFLYYKKDKRFYSFVLYHMMLTTLQPYVKQMLEMNALGLDCGITVDNQRRPLSGR